MNKQEINRVLSIITEIADGDESKPIGFNEIKQKTDIASDKLGNILIFLGKSGWIKNEYKAFNETMAVKITHEGIKQCFSLE